MENKITVKLEGALSDKLKGQYAKALAKILLEEYGREDCVKLLQYLQKNI
ncbi:hypothetical protein [Clostridium manihotivorum]|nr:hypothetical protein [Clostridium manihotivorum]